MSRVQHSVRNRSNICNLYDVVVRVSSFNFITSFRVASINADRYVFQPLYTNCFTGRTALGSDRYWSDFSWFIEANEIKCSIFILILFDEFEIWDDQRDKFFS